MAKSKRPKNFPPSQAENGKVSNSLAEVILDGTNLGTTEDLSSSASLLKNLRTYLISNDRSLLSQSYVEIGLIRTIVDVPVDDGMRGGVEIKSRDLSPEEIEELQFTIEQENDIGRMASALKWARLFGGGAILILTGQDPSTPLDLEAIGEDDPLEFKAVDMWEITFGVQNPSGAGMGGEPSANPGLEFFDYYGLRVHKSRILTLKGHEAPAFIRPRLRGWGLSEVEILVRSINQYLKANNLVFEVLDEFKVDIFKIKNLTGTLLTNAGTNAIIRRMQLANFQKNFQNAVVMDAEDDFASKELSFTGLAETMVGIRMHVASDLRMPLTKIFGISAAGFSSGEDDIENYNSMVESTIRTPSKHHILQMVKLRCQKLFGYIPEDVTVEFKPLRVLSSEQEENVKNARFDRMDRTFSKGMCTVREFKEACNKDKLLPIQLDVTVDQLEPLTTDEGDAEPTAVGKKSTTGAKEAKT